MSPSGIVKEEEDYENSRRAMNLVCMAVPAMVLKTVIELDVLEMIKKSGQLTAAEIAAQLPATNPEAAGMLGRLLRLLASYSVVTYSARPGPNGCSEMVFGLGPLAKFLTKNNEVVSYAEHSLFFNSKAFLQCWDQLKDAILDGGVPFDKTHGRSVFEYLPDEPKMAKTSDNVLTSYNYPQMTKLVDSYKGFEGLSSLVDVGGGTGACISVIASKYPTIKCINYDIPDVVKIAPPYPGVKHVAGDMYVSVPKADAIFMKYITHIASDEQCIRLFKNCYAALPDRGKVIVCDNIVPDIVENNEAAHRAFISDAVMLTFNGGRERTKSEFEALGKQAGFTGFQVVCYVCDFWVMEFLKN